MINKKKIAIVGIGKFGKKYLNETNKSELFICKYILRKNKIKVDNIDTLIFKKNIKLKHRIHAAIICSPKEEHYINAKYFLEKRIPIILEKPATNTLKEALKLNQLSKKKGVSVIVNYSDLYNPNLQELLKYRNQIGLINKIKINFNTFQVSKKKNFIILDWLPHIISIINKFITLDGDYLLYKNDIEKKKFFYHQLFKCKYVNLKNQKVDINFNNFSQLKKREVIIYGTKGLLHYDGYNNNKNYCIINNKKKKIIKKNRSIPIILEKLYDIITSKSYVNDMPQSISVQKNINKIKKLIK